MVNCRLLIAIFVNDKVESDFQIHINIIQSNRHEITSFIF